MTTSETPPAYAEHVAPLVLRTANGEETKDARELDARNARLDKRITRLRANRDAESET